MESVILLNDVAGTEMKNKNEKIEFANISYSIGSGM